MLNYVDDTCTTLKVKFQPSIWVWLRQSLIKLYLASLAVFGYGQTFRDFFSRFHRLAQDDFAQTQPAHAQHACEKDCSLTDQFHDDAWNGKLETANVRPQHRLIKYLISNLFDPMF